VPDAIAFMVMPFNEKPTGSTRADVPAKVDFDALWAEVHKPVLDDRGYTAVRADADTGALIIQQMIQRLALADLVIADITLPNANVYYEVGVRHAAKPSGCVLVSADWARPVFDLGQMRQLRYPLSDGAVGPAAAEAARAALANGLDALARGRSPVFDAVPGYPDAEKLSRASAFQDAVAELMEFDAEVRAVRAALSEDERRTRVVALVEQHGGSRAVREAVVLELVRLLRDHVGWQAVLDYIATLPADVADQAAVLEQRALAMSAVGGVADAVGLLEALIERDGETSERLGLLGGRYKRLADQAPDQRLARRYLDRAIECYQRGMLVNPADYYPAVNVMNLCRRRGDPDDPQRAADAAAVTAVACRAAIEFGRADEWVRPTLLSLAFSRGDLAEAMKIRREIERDGPARWELESTLSDLRASVNGQEDETVKAGLQQVQLELEQLLLA
jgi:hypothetical protein